MDLQNDQTDKPQDQERGHNAEDEVNEKGHNEVAHELIIAVVHMPSGLKWMRFWVSPIGEGLVKMCGFPFGLGPGWGRRGVCAGGAGWREELNQDLKRSLFKLLYHLLKD